MKEPDDFKKLFQVGAIRDVAAGIELLLLQKFIFNHLRMAPLAHPIFYQYSLFNRR